MTKLVNNSNLPLSVAVFLSANTYDFKPNNRSLSATDFNRSVRQVILRGRMGSTEDSNEPTDIVSLVKSRFGTALHDAIERTWLDPKLREAGLRNLGYPESVIERIVVNPTTLEPTQIPVYMEIRKSIEVDGWTISGKFDFVAEGTLTDFKSTSVHTHINKTNDGKYRVQGSIYKLIHKDIIFADHLNIVFWFTDWKQAMSLSDPTYPQSPVLQYKVPLMSHDETLEFIRQRIRQLELYEKTAEEDLPECSQDELWQDPPVYKYYADPMKKTRATKNFDSFTEARKHLAEKGFKGEVVTVSGKVNACNYCDAASICSQRVRLEAAGLLK